MYIAVVLRLRSFDIILGKMPTNKKKKTSKTIQAKMRMKEMLTYVLMR